MGRPSKSSTTATATKENKEVKANNAELENDILRKQLEEQNDKIAKLMEQMQAMAMAMATGVTKTDEPVKEQKTDRMITFVNLTNGIVVLRGSGKSIWTIDGQFNKRIFSEREAAVIVSNMANLFNSGAVYICDKDFVDECHLTEVYDNILSDEALKTLLDKDANTVIEIYDSASDRQQEIIVDMIINKIESGTDIDANIRMKIGKRCGKDLLSLEAEED